MDKNYLLSKCANAGKSVTPQRFSIIEELSNTDSGISAYKLLDRLNQKGNSFNISTIYRVLDFWTNVGIVHKIESNNTYLVCNDSHENHFHVLLHCTKCNSIRESCQDSKQLSLSNTKEFSPKENQVIEVKGLCSNCRY